MEIKTYSKIYRDMQNYIISHQDRITDFNDGGVLSSQCEATAREIGELYRRCRVGFSSYLRSLPYSVFDFRMKAGEKASTHVIFSRSRPFSYDTTIPVGTILASGSLIFLTTEEGTVLSGEIDSLPLSVIAKDVGEQYNIRAGMIKVIKTTLSADIVTVNNPQPATGGIDAENWPDYLDRFAEYILGLQRTNWYGFSTGLTSGPIVRSYEIEEHFPPIDNLWNMTVYVEDGSGGMTADALKEAKKIIDGKVDPSNGGYRAPGVNVRYFPPEIIPIQIHVRVKVEYDFANEVDTSIVIFEVQEVLQRFVNSHKIGEEIKKSDIIVILKRFPYLIDADIILPAENIPISKKQIARFGNCIVSVVIEQR